MPRKALTTKEPSSNKKDSFQCIACKKNYTKLKYNFPASQSSLYAGNAFYLPWCWRCIDGYYMRYRDDCGLSEEEAIHRLCAKFDIYWSKDIYNSMESSTSATKSRMRSYVSRTNLVQHSGKTYDDTIAEEAKAVLLADGVSKQQEGPEEPEVEIPDGAVEFWGRGFSAEDYIDLQASYDRLTAGMDVSDPATQMLVKQACLSEVEISSLRREGRPYEKQQASLISTLGSLNLKPSQIKDAEKNSGIDGMPLGVGIQRWEQTRPLPEIDPSWKDVDRIAQYMMTWYTGASMRMFDVDNEYTEIFNKAIDKYSVQRPSPEGESDDKAVISYIVAGGDKNA